MTAVDGGLGVAEGRGLGCSMRLVVTRPTALAEAERAVQDVLEAVDRTCSRFREDSELSRLAGFGGREVNLSPLLADALDAALRAAEATSGAVDPTVGSAVRLAGYDRDFTLVAPSAGAIRLSAVPAPGWRSIELDVDRRRVRIPENVEIDLGATAKAFAADRASAAVAAVTGGGGVLVSLGGDIATQGEPPPGGWRIQVGEDGGAELYEDAESITVGQAGVATSSTQVRRWLRGATTLHHIIDPRTGLPAAGPWRSASVVAASCLDANAASTAAIVLGEDALSWLESTGLPARLVDRHGAVTRIGGWPEPLGVPRA